jgi:phosphoglycolate phosphatase
MKLVVFDVDGTLVDSQSHILGARAHAHAALGVTLPPRPAVLGIVGLSLPQAMAHLHPDAPPDRIDALVQGYKGAFGQMRAQTESPLYPGARDILDRLAARDDLVLGVATGKSRRGLTLLLAAHGLQGYFRTTQVADDHPSKPHPAMLRAALSEAGVQPRDAVMVGDTSFDMQMAQAAGVAGIGVSWGYHPIAALGQAMAVIDRFDDLPAVIDSLWAPA